MKFPLSKCQLACLRLKSLKPGLKTYVTHSYALMRLFQICNTDSHSSNVLILYNLRSVVLGSGSQPWGVPLMHRGKQHAPLMLPKADRIFQKNVWCSPFEDIFSIFLKLPLKCPNLIFFLDSTLFRARVCLLNSILMIGTWGPKKSEICRPSLFDKGNLSKELQLHA